MLESSKNTVLLFGSFDGIHVGHEYLINEALKYGSHIVVVVAQDSIIESIKQQTPMYSLDVRIANLKERFPETTPIVGDREKGTWSAIKDYQPETILVGYDQHGLKEALQDIQEQYEFTIVQAKAFQPEKYKSSILRNKKK